MTTTIRRTALVIVVAPMLFILPTKPGSGMLSANSSELEVAFKPH